MTKQEIYDTVCAHLAQQKTRAMAETRCAYRGQNNTSCAVGCLITDEEYDPEMDGSTFIDNSVMSIFDRYPNIAQRIGRNNINLLMDLQAAHDDRTLNSDKLVSLLKVVTRRYNLTRGAEEQITEWNA